jgi:hypothetical protein
MRIGSSACGAVAIEFGCRQLQRQHRHVGRRPLDRRDAAGHLARREVPESCDLPHFEHKVGARLGAAQKRHSSNPLVAAQRRRRVRALLDLPLQYPGLARAAGAVLAAVRQADAAAQCRIEDVVCRFGRKLAARGPYQDFERHKIRRWIRKRSPRSH